MEPMAKQMWQADAQKAKYLSATLMRKIRAHKAVGKEFTDDVKKLCSLVDKLTTRTD